MQFVGDADRETSVVREQTARSMRSNRDGKTHPEIDLRKRLWRAGIRGYRLHQRLAGSRPDLLFARARVAIFLHGCFWHRCPTCKKERQLKTNADFWRSKMINNEDRDRRAITKLRQMGYEAIVIWECELRRDPEGAVAKVKSVLDARLSACH